MEQLEKLEQLTLQFDKIFFFPYILDDRFLKWMLNSGNMNHKKYFMILGEDYTLEDDLPFVKRISRTDAEELIRLYHTYEFADNFFMIAADEDSSAANIFNFVRTGMLTYEEAWQALLS